MKKALALVLALVLALSMAVSAFAVPLKNLTLVPEAAAKTTNIPLVDVTTGEWYIDLSKGGTYYFALTDAKWFDIELTTNGNVTAELVEYDPATMNIEGLEVQFDIVDRKGNVDTYICNANDIDAYKAAVKYADDKNAPLKAEEYSVKLHTNVNIVKFVVEDNYTAHYTEGLITIKAKLENAEKKVENYVGYVTIINDAIIFEYEEVKYTASKFDKEAALLCGDKGYSDWYTAEDGYSKVFGADYSYKENRQKDYATVVSTTAFRAIEGEDLAVVAYGGNVQKVNTAIKANVSVELYDIVKGQKGVNFAAYTDVTFTDTIKNFVLDVEKEALESINFGFKGDQVVKGAYEITFALDLDWYDLRELFGVKVEEDDIISYYLVDENGKVVGGKEVDYMTAALTEDAEFTIKGSNSALGQYKLVLEVPAAEVGEANPNTGAEAVVGVVAALAVVSVATAAAVSLKK